LGTELKNCGNYAVDFVNATRWIKQHLPGAKVLSVADQYDVQVAIHTCHESP